MPQRTNSFQELVTLLTQIAGKDAVVTASELLPDGAIPGETREVDVCIRSTVGGHEVFVGIECRMSERLRPRPQTVEWVEAMHAKHLHLPTNKVVLVSSTGFTKTALKLAEYFKMKAITPTDVQAGFVGDIVNKIHTVWAKRFDITAKRTVFFFDPPLADADNIEIGGPLELLDVVDSEGTSICPAKDLTRKAIQEIDLSNPAFRDAVAGEAELNLSHTPTRNDGSPLYIVIDLSDPPKRRRITKVEITSRVMTYVEEVPLKHGQYENTPYSTGTAAVGDVNIHWVVTEDAAGKQMGARIAPVGEPTRGQFYPGKMG